MFCYETNSINFIKIYIFASELCFNKWKNAIRTQYYETLEELVGYTKRSDILGFFIYSLFFIFCNNLI